MSKTTSIGQKAYFMRRTLGLSWLQVAKRLNYKADRPDFVRQRAILGLAKAYAIPKGLAWPLH